MSAIIPEWLDRVINSLALRGTASLSTVQGCTQSEVAAIADGKSLPLRYLEFLYVMGSGAGRFYYGSDIFYPSIVGLTEAAKALVLEDPAGLVLPADAFAFAMHQGYEVLFFRLNEGDDPPVYHYIELGGVFEARHRSFSDFLLCAADDKW